MKNYGILGILVIVGIIGFSGMVQANLNRGLVVYYPFNGNTNDESRNTNDGTEHGNISYGPGIIEQSAYLSGVNDYISIWSAEAANNTRFSSFLI